MGWYNVTEVALVYGRGSFDLNVSWSCQFPWLAGLFKHIT